MEVTTLYCCAYVSVSKFLDSRGFFILDSYVHLFNFLSPQSLGGREGSSSVAVFTSHTISRLRNTWNWWRREKQFFLPSFMSFLFSPLNIVPNSSSLDERERTKWKVMMVVYDERERNIKGKMMMMIAAVIVVVVVVVCIVSSVS